MTPRRYAAHAEDRRFSFSSVSARYLSQGAGRFFLTSSGLPVCHYKTSSHSTSPLSVTFGFR